MFDRERRTSSAAGSNDAVKLSSKVQEVTDEVTKRIRDLRRAILTGSILTDDLTAKTIDRNYEQSSKLAETLMMRQCLRRAFMDA